MQIRRHIIHASRQGTTDDRPGALPWRVQPRDLLVAAATFLVVLAVLLHVLTDDRLAETVPASRTVVEAVATGATVLVPGESAPRQDVTLTRARTIDLVPAPVPDVDAYLVSTSTTLPDGTFTDRGRWTGVQERVTGRVVASPANRELVTTSDANGNAVEELRPLRAMGGLLLRFPRDTPARDQLRWDPLTRSVGTAELVGEKRVDRSRVLEFVQRSETSVDGTRTTAETNLSVRPETGTVVREVSRVRISRADGASILDARFVDEPAAVRKASSEVDRLVRRDRTYGTVLPAVVLFLGIMVALAAVIEGRFRRLRSRSRREGPEEAR